MTCLSACASDLIGTRENARAEIRQELSPLCPYPTDRGKLVKIAAELDAAIKAGTPPNTLATEYERLDAAARGCRGVK